MAARRRQSQFVTRAAQQALVRFGPELDVLKELQREARDTYSSTVGAARAAAEITQRAVDEARPGLRQVYDRAGLDQARVASSFLSPDLAKLGPIADAIKAAAATEASGAARRLSEAQASALADLDDRRVRAAEGAMWAQTSAKDRLVSDLAKVLERQAGLSREAGAFQASTVADLEAEAAKQAHDAEQAALDRANSRGNALIGQGLDPDTGRRLPSSRGGKRLAAGGRDALSRDKHLEWSSAVQQIVQQAQRYKPLIAQGKIDRQGIVRKLATGRPQQKVWVDAKGNPVAKGTPGATEQTLPGMPARPADIRMTAALDVALDGHLSRNTQKELQRKGFILSELGLPTYGEWLKAQGGPRKAAARGITQALTQAIVGMPRVRG